MAKPDMPYGLFPWLVPPGTAPSGAPAVDLATAMKWYWRVKSWTAAMTGTFSVNVAMHESTWYGSTGTSNIEVTAVMSVAETFDVIGPGLDELSLCLTGDPPYSGTQYQWIARPSPSVSCSISVVDSLGYSYGPASALYVTGVPPRTLFAPEYPAPFYSDGWRHMTRDAVTGLFTPFLGDGSHPGPAPLWQGGSWGQIQGTIGPSGSGFGTPYGGFGGSMLIDIQPVSSVSEGLGGGVYLSGDTSVIVTGSIDGHAFSANGFCEWAFDGQAGEGGYREPTGVTYSGGGAISLTITPAEYWTYAPRIDSANPTYDPTTGAIATNPATGAPWTLQEIISRQGP